MNDTIKKDGLTLTIETDECLESPREWDNFGTMACKHPRYRLGDKNHGLSDEPENWAQELDEMGAVYLPLWLYDHGGITMRTAPFGRWDNTIVGYIFATPDKMKAEGVTPERALEILRKEVETYDQYLTGDVYAFLITVEDTGECLDSCNGFYGEQHAMEEGMAQLHAILEERRKEKQAKIKTMIKNHVPLLKR